jgi:hypothetical protein
LLIVENERNCSGGLYLSALARGIADTLDEFDRRLIVLAQMIELDKQLRLVVFILNQFNYGMYFFRHIVSLCRSDIGNQMVAANTVRYH